MSRWLLESWRKTSLVNCSRPWLACVRKLAEADDLLSLVGDLALGVAMVGAIAGKGVWERGRVCCAGYATS